MDRVSGITISKFKHMKRLKNILGIVAALFIAQPIYAQVVPGAAGYYNDALLFSNTQYGASARVLGIGGASDVSRW